MYGNYAKKCCWNLLHFIFLSSWKLQINYSTEFNQTAYINYGFGSQLTEKDYLRLALLMICPWFVDIEYWYKNDPYIIIYKISQLVYFKYSILTNHGRIINFTLSICVLVFTWFGWGGILNRNSSPLICRFLQNYVGHSFKLSA